MPGFDPVPWFVGGGATHSPEVARLLAYNASSGSEGVGGAADLKVTALATPGSQVNVAPGSCTVLNRATGGSQQTYMGRAQQTQQVPIAATGSGGGRTDLVVARVEDPFVPGSTWPAPADPTQGTYIFARVISGVPAGTVDVQSLGLGYSAVALARIDVPANTGAITDAMVTDLRAVALPRNERPINVYYPPAPQSGPGAGLGRVWFPQVQYPVWCPRWATKLKMVVTVSGLYIAGTVQATMQAEYGYNGSPLHIDTQTAGIISNNSGGQRISVTMGGDLKVPSSWRGKVNYVQLSTQMAANQTGTMLADTFTTVVMDTHFHEHCE